MMAFTLFVHVSRHILFTYYGQGINKNDEKFEISVGKSFYPLFQVVLYIKAKAWLSYYGDKTETGNLTSWIRGSHDIPIWI